MNSQPIVTDTLIERMLARRARDLAPVGLRDAIGAAVANTPQVRRRWWAPILAPTRRMPAPGLAWLVALVGLLLAAAVAAALVGGQLLRQSDELSLVPAVSEPPSPETSPIVTASAFGPITWHTLDEPPMRLTGSPYGPIAVTDDGLRWLRPDGTWGELTLEGPLPAAFSVGVDVIVGGSQPFWLHRVGSDWVVGEPLDLDGVMDVDRVAAGPRGIVVSNGIAVQHAADGVHFVRAERPPDKAMLDGHETDCFAEEQWTGAGSIGPLIATADGFVALSAGTPADWRDWPVCDPVVWDSADGSTWNLASPVSPFGPGASVREVASRGARHVAIGEIRHLSALWVSDDGHTWEPLPTPEPAGRCPWQEPQVCSHLPSRVVAGSAGWAVLDYDGFAWTSADGRTWEALDGWPGVGAGWLKQAVALSPGSIVVATPGEAAVIGSFEP